ncbi:MAG: hypothetical protein SOZ26_03865, partial [Bacteroidaceae bacterium]|nr:hypothetical protein [Bacteroidaceae bacterium]
TPRRDSAASLPILSMARLTIQCLSSSNIPDPEAERGCINVQPLSHSEEENSQQLLFPDFDSCSCQKTVKY